MKIVVSGATGFVGGHVVAELRHRGAPPTLMLRPGTAVPVTLSDLPVVRLDVDDLASGAFDRLGRPDVVIHLAWGGLPNYASPHHLERELPAHAAFLSGLVEAGLPSLTVAGTCLEYGLASGALREDLPCRPITAYGTAKNELRLRLEGLRRRRPFRLTWARLFYVYGNGQAPGSLIPQLERAIERGDTAFDMSGGNQLRDYVPIEEAASNLVTLALNGRDNGIVNICSGRPISVLSLVESIVARHGSRITLNLGRYPYPEYEPMEFWGDRSKLDECLRAIDVAV